MGDQVDFSETRLLFVPFGASADGDLAFEERAWFGGAQTPAGELLADRGQVTVDGGRTHLAEQNLHRVWEHQFPMPFQHGDHLGYKRLQALPTDPITGLPDEAQSAVDLGGIDAWAAGSGLGRPGRLAALQQLDRVLAMIASVRHELVQNVGLLRFAGPAIAWSDGRQQLAFALGCHIVASYAVVEPVGSVTLYMKERYLRK
jgi:hypothetical protein